jgi:cytochrome c-type biogenesis protein CcmH/NrfG
LNNSPRGLTLYATVLIKDPLQLSTTKAKPLVEKALAADPNHLPAVYLLAKILEQEMNLEKAIDLLKKQLGNYYIILRYHDSKYLRPYII